MSNTPSDEELNSVLCHHWPAFPMQAVLVQMWLREAMRSALAKWGTPQPAPAPLSDDDVRDAAFEAVRKKLCALPRFSFLSDGFGVRRVPDKSGSWIAFDDAHELFDPVAVDAALAAQGGK